MDEYKIMDGYTYRHSDSPTDRQTQGLTDRHIDGQKY